MLNEEAAPALPSIKIVIAAVVPKIQVKKEVAVPEVPAVAIEHVVVEEGKAEAAEEQEEEVTEDDSPDELEPEIPSEEEYTPKVHDDDGEWYPGSKRARSEKPKAPKAPKAVKSQVSVITVSVHRRIVITVSHVCRLRNLLRRVVRGWTHANVVIYRNHFVFHAAPKPVNGYEALRKKLKMLQKKRK